MLRVLFVHLALVITYGIFCFQSLFAETPMPAKKRLHEVVDINHWIDFFPLKLFEKTEGPRKYRDSNSEDLVDLWKPSGEFIISPAHLAMTEQVRRRAAKTHNLGKAIPTDLFLLGVGEPKLPYLTKVGGTPYRPADHPWPKAPNGEPLTFLLQFCFLDSKDIIPSDLPGDVMLLFAEDWNSLGEPEKPANYRIEWSRVPLNNPMTAAQCPKTNLKVPKYFGVIYRMNEYPDSWDTFRKEGHNEYWLLAVTQATRIGSETFFIQQDPRKKGETLLCSFSCIGIWNNHAKGKENCFPLINVPTIGEVPKEYANNQDLMLGDCGCLYILRDAKGNIRLDAACY
jgi:hypothetical protein